MCAHERGLGRGLDSLFRNAGEAISGKEYARLPVASLKANSNQPRNSYNEETLDELAESIKAQGIIQPILVRPLRDAVPQQYEIVAGERRWRAAQKAGLTDVPVLIRELTDNDVLAVALIENLQREDLNAVDEAQAIDKLRQALQISQEEVARRLGKSRSAIANALRLLQLPEAMLRSLEQGAITAGHARALLAIDNPDVQAALHEAMLLQDVSVRAAEAAATYWKRHNSLPEALMGKAARATQRGRQARAKPAFIVALQRHLRERIHPKVTLNGTQEMGLVTVPYETSEQLRDLLAKFGIAPQDLLGVGQAPAKGDDDVQA